VKDVERAYTIESIQKRVGGERRQSEKIYSATAATALGGS
jgi:hypothetical protein